MPIQTHIDKALFIEVTETGEEVRLTWRGKSNEREPARFLVPILGDALQRAAHANKRMTLDFSALEYMNSSTFSPLVRVLDEATRSRARVNVEYSRARKWQSLSFTAIKAFETKDGSITIVAK